MMRTKRRAAASVGVCGTFALLCLAAGSVSAADDLAPVLGKWKLTIDGGGEIYTAWLTLDDQDGTLGGRYENEGRRTRVESAELRARTLTLTVSTQRFSRPVTATFTGEIADDAISGEVDFVSGSSSRSYDFRGKRISRPFGLTESDDSDDDADTDKSNEPGGSEPAAEEPAKEMTDASAKSPAPAAGRTVSFRYGVSGYTKTVDAEIWSIAPTKSLLTQGTMTTDGNNGGGESQVLLRFEDIFGDAESQIPPQSRIVSAKLTVVAFDPGTTCYLHRLLVPWHKGVTWDGMANGVSIDDIEASSVRDGFTFAEINMDKQLVEFDVTQTVQMWADGAVNHGWVFVNTGSNGWDFYSSDWIEPDARPMLEVTCQPR